MKMDIKNRKDIILLVDQFYEKIKSDIILGYIFNDVAKVNWAKHLPIMYDFWENTLFFTGSYTGNPINLHSHLHRLTPLNQTHFDQWNHLFISTIDAHFSGENAELAKQRAISISLVLSQKIAQTNALEQFF
ncbi:MAG: group III truncated hemoglobin [Chitinophagia bacterium]|jgi:hemoglobin